MSDEKKDSLVPFVLFAVIILIMVFLIMPIFNNAIKEIECGNSCFGECKQYNKLYCEREEQHQQREHERWLKERQIKKEFEIRRSNCYLNGTKHNQSFDVIEDYKYTCPKLEYINDHLLTTSEKKNTGYIKGSSHSWSLFGSGHGSIEGKFYQYVDSEVLATGQLMQQISYCESNKEKFDLKKDFYTEQEFIMYYVDNCIN